MSQKPPEIEAALSALEMLSSELPADDITHLRKALPALARKMAQAGESVNPDILVEHVKKGEQHLKSLNKYYSPDKNISLDYDTIIQNFKTHVEAKARQEEKQQKFRLQKALSAKDINTVLSLLSLPSKEDALCWSAGNGYLEMVDRLIEAGADIHAYQDEAFRLSASNGNVAVVERLIKAGANIHADNDAALRWSAGNGYLEMVDRLIEAGADIHANKDEALRLSAGNDHLEVVERLIEAGADASLLNEDNHRKLEQRKIWKTMFPALQHGNNAIYGLTPHHFNQDAYQGVLGYIQQEMNSKGGQTQKYAYQAACLFKSEHRILQYLQKWGQDGKQPLHDIIQNITIPQEGRPDLKAWGDAVLKHGPKMARFVKFSDRLTQPVKDGSGGWSYTKTKEEIAKHAFKRGHKNPRLASFCFEHAWDDDDFEDALKQIKKFKKKYNLSDLPEAANDNIKGGAIPEITIDGREFGKDEYTFRKLPDGDVRGLLLGEFTNCCQHLASAGRDCAKHGFQSPNGGFYVVEDNKTGDIVGQTWAWRGKQGELVFDSLESLSGHFNAEKWSSLCRVFSEKIKQTLTDTGITEFNVGTGGATPIMKNFNTADKVAKPIDYKGYRDSREQYLIASF